MLIAIDYDDTYTVDPEGWDGVIALLRARGHSWVCVTGRAPNTPMAHEVTARLHQTMPIVFAGSRFKREAAEGVGLKVDVWIDDCPMMIDKQVILL